MLLQKLHDHCFGSLSCGDGLDRFCEVVCSSEDPTMSSRGRWVYFSNKIQLPLLERGLNMYGIQRKWKKHPPSLKYLTFVAGIKFLVSIEEDSGSIQSCPHDLVYSGLPIVMSSTFSWMEFLNEPIFLLLIYTVQQHSSWLVPIQFPL